MDNFVVDSSVWIDFFNKKKSNQIEVLKDWIVTQEVVSRVNILPAIYQEVLQGIREDKMFSLVKEVLQGFNFPELNMFVSSENAAVLFRNLQKKGITISKQNDCLIAAICLDNNYTLLHNDKDFDNIAKYTSLKIYK